MASPALELCGALVCALTTSGASTAFRVLGIVSAVGLFVPERCIDGKDDDKVDDDGDDDDAAAEEEDDDDDDDDDDDADADRDKAGSVLALCVLIGGKVLVDEWTGELREAPPIPPIPPIPPAFNEVRR